MRVIDGVHRLKAAVLRGDRQIEAKLYEGAADDAFVLAVHANVTHGLPLSLDDRVHATTRIIGSHPQWSDRAIAAVAGLSPKTVAAIRLRSTANTESSARIGKDGRIRPISSAAGRRLAGELMTRNPEASLRQIAKAVGLAPSTIMDVRARLRAGRDPVPDSQISNRKPRNAMTRKRRIPAKDSVQSTITNRASAINTLMQDPSIRLSGTGRRLLRWLEAQPNTVPDWERVIDNVPEHCLEIVAELARDSAKAWHAVVDRLERRTQTRTRHP